MTEGVQIALIGVGCSMLTLLLNRLLDFLAERRKAKSGKTDKLTAIQKQLNKVERDSCRTQLLLLMRDYPDQTEEIMRLAQHYFDDLDGNWYMTSLFSTWLGRNGLDKPTWMAGGES